MDAEFLAGVSASGTVVGPWQTLVNFEVGVPVAGPAENFTREDRIPQVVGLRAGTGTTAG
jgi:hypothetical protein